MCSKKEKNEHNHSISCGCACSHEHHHEHNHEHVGDSMKSKIVVLMLTCVLLAVAVWVEKMCHLATWQLLLVYIVPYLLVGYDTLKEAAEGILKGDVFNEDFLMSIATIGALSIGFMPGAETEFTEAVFVMLFFQIGEMFEHYAEGQSRKSISHLMNIRPDMANVERNGQLISVDPNDVKVGEVVVIKPGEKVPLDGIVLEGTTSLNTIALTGESVPRKASVGDEIISGCINITGVVRIKTTKVFGESTVSKIIQLVESADQRKSKSESFITRFARVYTPIVVIAALLLAFVPPLFDASNFSLIFSTWLHRALIFLVVSCPCALVISVPLTFFGGLGGASRKGILIKGSNYVDVLAELKTIVFDKTGTLTHGKFAVEAVHPNDFDEKELLHLAAHVEHYSTHPIGAALRDAFPNEGQDGCVVTNVEEVTGQGIQACVSGHHVCVGNAKMMQALGVECHECHSVGTIVHVSVDGRYVGHIVINDMIKRDSAEAIQKLKTLGITKSVMLTGDRYEVAKLVAERLHIDDYHAELLPTDKVKCVEQLLSEKGKGETLAFVGDGINDAPVLRRADVGIAMGGLGSDAAIEAADVVLMDDKPSKLAVAIQIARRTRAIAHQNVVFAIGVKVLILFLATMGIGTMWMAVFADVGVTILAVLNAMRALRA